MNEFTYNGHTCLFKDFIKAFISLLDMSHKNQILFYLYESSSLRTKTGKNLSESLRIDFKII